MRTIIESGVVRFRGKRLADLEREDLLDALEQALQRVMELEGRVLPGQSQDTFTLTN